MKTVDTRTLDSRLEWIESMYLDFVGTYLPDMKQEPEDFDLLLIFDGFASKYGLSMCEAIKTIEVFLAFLHREQKEG